MRKIVFLFFTNVLLSCYSQQQNQLINPNGKTIKERFIVPAGFKRIEDPNSSLDEFLRNLPLKPHLSKVYLFNSKLKNRQDVHEAVIDYNIGKKNLQQCADAVMRIRAEYLYSSNQFDKIHFDFTNGTKAEFSKYGDGYRYSAKTNCWTKTAGPDFTYENFQNFMELVYTYAGTLSLSKELLPIKNLQEIKPGDVFIKGGSPGHAVTVLDVAKNPETNATIFIIAQSYMPAQNIHLLKNLNSPMISPWYSIDFGQELKTPEWTFGKNELMRFED